jgi:hypothetical protein
MSTWRDKLQTASFRGVEFAVSEASFTGGRRSVMHEFPQRDVPYTQDLGRKGKVFQVSGFVIGDDYLARRDRLINALDRKGKGELVHPYYGKLTVQSGDYSVKESADSGGMAEFSMSFSQSAEIQFNNISSPNGIAIGEALFLDMMDFSSDLFFPSFDVSGISFVLSSAVNFARNINNFTKKLLSPIATAAGVLDSAASAFNSIAVEGASLLVQPVKLVNAFQEPFKKIAGGLGQLDRVGASYARLRTGDRGFDQIRIQSLRNSLRLYRQIKSLNEAQPGDSPDAIRMARNAKALRMLNLCASSALVGDSLLTAPYETLSDAKKDKMESLEILDDLMEEIQEFPDHEDLYVVVMDYKVHLNEYTPIDSGNLKEEKIFTFPSTTNSLSTSWALYGSIDQEQAIIDRNGVSNPAVIPAFNGVKYVG